MVNFLVYVIGFLCLISAIFFFKRKDERISVFIWAPINYIIFMCYQGLVGTVLSLFKIPISNVSVGISDIVAGILLWVYIKKKGRQKYNAEHAVTFVCLVVATAIIAYYRFGMGLFPNFQTVDGATHFWFAKRIINYGWSETNLILSAMDDAMWMQALSIKTGPFDMYRTYILMEVFHLSLAGLTFVSLISRFLVTRLMKVTGFIVTFVYFLGYPLYALEFGFSYFGLSITVIAFCLFILHEWMENGLNERVSYVLLSLGLFGLFISYTFFVPIVFFGIFISIALWQRQKGIMVSKDTIKKMLGVFLFPSLLGLIQSGYNILYLNIAGSTVESEAGNTMGIAEDGGCYGDMYSNFILLFVFVAVAIWLCIRDKRLWEPCIWILALSLVFTAVMFVFAMRGEASVYYYSKTASLMWLICFVLLMYALRGLSDTLPVFPVAVCALYIILLGTVYARVDEAIIAKEPRFIQSGAEGFVNIHAFTRDIFVSPYYLEQMDLFEYIYTNVSPNTGECVTVSEPLFGAWCFRMTEQGLKTEIFDPEVVMNSVATDETEYLLCQYVIGFDEKKESFRALGDVVYENQTGEVIKLRR